MMPTPHKEKAWGYSRFICLGNDGNWVRIVWQLRTDRNDSIKSGNEQWIGRERSTYLKALWVQVSKTEELGNSEEVQEMWDPCLEFAPLSQVPETTKGSGKKYPTPPELPKESADVDMDKGTGSASHGYPSGVGARPSPAATVGGASPPTDAEWKPVILGNINDEYYQEFTIVK